MARLSKLSELVTVTILRPPVMLPVPLLQATSADPSHLLRAGSHFGSHWSFHANSYSNSRYIISSAALSSRIKASPKWSKDPSTRCLQASSICSYMSRTFSMPGNRSNCTRWLYRNRRQSLNRCSETVEATSLSGRGAPIILTSHPTIAFHLPAHKVRRQSDTVPPTTASDRLAEAA